MKGESFLLPANKNFYLPDKKFRISPIPDRTNCYFKNYCS